MVRHLPLPRAGVTGVIEETSVSGVEDSVRVYLRQMGRVPLLSAQREVELARRIETGREAVILAVLGRAGGPPGLADLASGVGRREVDVDTVVDPLEQELTDAQRTTLARRVGRGL